MIVSAADAKISAIYAMRAKSLIRGARELSPQECRAQAAAIMAMLDRLEPADRIALAALYVPVRSAMEMDISPLVEAIRPRLERSDRSRDLQFWVRGYFHRSLIRASGRAKRAVWELLDDAVSRAAARFEDSLSRAGLIEGEGEEC